MIADNETSDVIEVASRHVSFPASDGKLIVGYLDEGPERFWNGRIVVLSPKYGETKKNNIRMSYFLSANGFKVIRFDHTDHIGESDGEMANFTLPGAVQDIIQTVIYVDKHFEPDEIVLVSNSLSARCAYRATAVERRISRLVCVVGVVNLLQTIKNIYQKDIIGTFCEGKRWGVIDILGFDIDSENFISHLVEADMHDFSGTKVDAARITQPLLHLHASNDRWVEFHEVEEAVQLAEGKLEHIKDAYHEVGENPEAARKSLESVVRFCLSGTGSEAADLRHPSKKRLFEQNRLERNRLRQQYAVKETESDFWSSYLGKFGTMEQAGVYIDYFEKVQSLLGDLNEGDVMLDAGCGNGFFGLCMLHALETSLGTKSYFPSRFVYHGIDLTVGGLTQAYKRHVKLQQSLLNRELGRVQGVTFAYQKMDFDEALAAGDGRAFSYADCSVAKVCCSLVISYLSKPLDLFREFYRILRKGGVAVISTMKPDCDMTVLYHEFITMDPSSAGDAADNAQRLLGAAGQIKLKEQSGIYGFYSEQDLLSFAELAGFAQCDVFRSLGNQANIIRVVK